MLILQVQVINVLEMMSMNKRLSHLFVIRKHMLLSALGLAIGYIAVAMLGIFTGDLIDSMLNVQVVDGVWQKLRLLVLRWRYRNS